MGIKHQTVPMPKKKITYKKGPRGTLYVYYTLRAYRNAQGKPTSDEVSIGKKDFETGGLIPNANYFKHVPEPVIAEIPKKIKSYGNSYILYDLAKKLGIERILRNCFEDDWQLIMTIACYMICEGNVMMYLPDWCDTTYTILPKNHETIKSSELFSQISYESRLKFFSEWIKLRREQEYIAYDVTSISTHATGIDIAEWGYNRDKESLAQINLGMYLGQTSKLPVFYNTYSRSIADKSHLSFMLENTKALGIDNIRFVLDRGFLTQDNLKYMHENNYPFIIPFVSSRVEASKIVNQVKNNLRRAVNWMSEVSLYGTCIDYQIYDINLKAHVFFCPDKCADEEKRLYTQIDVLEAELEKMIKPKKITKKYTQLFKIEEESDISLHYERDYSKIDELLQQAGYFVFLTTDSDCTPAELIQTYRGRDGIEKAFDNLKNELDFKRLRTHLSNTTDGKVFVAFIALIIRSYLQSQIKQHHKAKKLTLQKVLLELTKIKLVTLNDGTNTLMPLTKAQKTILEALDISVEALHISPKVL